MSELSEEEIARALCRVSFDGYDPDEIVTHKPPPYDCVLPSDPNAEEHCYYDTVSDDWAYAWRRWRLYAPAARAVLALLQPALERARREERERCATVIDAEAAFARESHDVITDEENSNWVNDIKIRHHWRMRAEIAERAAAAIRKG